MNNKHDDLLPGLSGPTGLQFRPGISMEELKKQLSAYIDQLIQHDFNRLVSLLYRLDIDEQNLRRLLAGDRAPNASEIIADLIVERQLEKLRSRQRFSSPGENNISEDEKW